MTTIDHSANLQALPLGGLILAQAIDAAAARLNAVESNIPGLWFAPNYPELTTNQMLQIAAGRK